MLRAGGGDDGEGGRGGGGGADLDLGIRHRAAVRARGASAERPRGEAKRSRTRRMARPDAREGRVTRGSSNVGASSTPTRPRVGSGERSPRKCQKVEHLSDRPPQPPQGKCQIREGLGIVPPGRSHAPAARVRRVDSRLTSRTEASTRPSERRASRGSRALGPGRSSTPSDSASSRHNWGCFPIPTGERRDGARHGRHRRGDARGERARGVHQVPGRTFAFPSSPAHLPTEHAPPTFPRVRHPLVRPRAN